MLALALLVRIAFAVAYFPALLYSDSWDYLATAFGHWPVAVTPLRPPGYPLALRTLSPFGLQLEVVTVVQHVSGLAVAALTYAIAVRLAARRGAAAAAAAVVALDAYAITLEQFVLAEALFTLGVVAALCLTVTGAPRPRRLAAAGALLAAAALMRPIAVFAVPVWLIGCAGLRPGRRAWTVGAAGAVVPLVAYCAVHAALTGTFGLTQSTGWFLYGRVAPLVRCSPAGVPPPQRPLCEPTAADRGKGANYFMFNPHSPAARAYGRISRDRRRQARSDAALLDFSLGVIRHRPLAYAGAALADTARFFVPGSATRNSRGDDGILVPPAQPRLRWDDPATHARLLPHYAVARSPLAPALHAYGRVVHTPRWLLAACAIAAVAAIATAPRGRAWRLALLVGCPVAMLLGAAASAAFALRYVVPTAPLLLAAGTAGASEIARSLASMQSSSSR